MVERVAIEVEGRQLSLEAGRVARQTDGAVWVQYGDTVVLVTAVAAKHAREGIDFFPLTVDYQERAYAAGMIPGGFFKREGQPRDQEKITARLIDRPIRPLFPKGFKNETQVFVYVLSADQENDADTVGLIAASLALSLSRVPWNGPVAAVRIGRIEGEWVVNPTFEQLDESDIDLVVAGRKGSVLMVEGGALELSESDMIAALGKAQEAIDELLTVEQEIIGAASVEKMQWTPEEIPEEIERRVRELAEPKMADALFGGDKLKRRDNLSALKQSVLAELAEEFPEAARKISEALSTIEGEVTRARVLEVGERVDGRDSETVRPIECEVGILPRTHGSSLFQRGETQALVTTTLGSVGDEQRVDTIDLKEQTSKSFMLHYNFPPFSVGEVRPVRGVSRREIGHGMLAERALQVILTPYEEFPYSLRVAAEFLESSGSSSLT
ncbi:MAG: polyribonucleotide nucleotidyltransferase, partial [candidate division NC10 bacterium]|nr:polyribonucleotide nucleotidyltransferase [candidate division NC10 bacterium]